MCLFRRGEKKKTLDISGSTYEKALKCLKDKKIITGSRGAYVLDPNIHWKGDYKSREALMKSKLQITLSAIGDFEKEGN